MKLPRTLRRGLLLCLVRMIGMDDRLITGEEAGRITGVAKAAPGATH